MISYESDAATLQKNPSELSGPMSRGAELNKVYKSNKSKESQVCSYEDGIKIDDETLLDQVWCLQGKIADHYIKLTEKCIKILSKLESMLNGHLRRVIVVKHRMKLSPADTRPAYSSCYLKSSKDQKL